MKKTLLTLSLLITTIIGSAQDKGFVAISLGSSTPISDFASTDPHGTSSGYAREGFFFDLSFGAKFSKYFGFTGLIREQVNSIDAQSMADYLAQQNPGYSNTVSTTGWTIGGYMAGAYGSFPVAPKMSIESRVMFGFLTATSPDITVSLTNGTNPIWMKEHSASSATFSYLFGVGYKINMGKHFFWAVNFDYLGAKPEFSDVLTTYSFTTSSKDTWSQKFGTINYGFCFGYRFGAKTLSIKDI